MKRLPTTAKINATAETTEQMMNRIVGEACLAIGAGDLRGYLFRLWSTARREGFDIGQAIGRRHGRKANRP